MGKVRVCNEPLYSSGIITRNTDEQAGNEDDRNYRLKEEKMKNEIKSFQIEIYLV